MSDDLKTEVLYRLLWEYRQRWRVTAPLHTQESMGFAYVEGMVEGRLAGRFRGVNHARMRSDGRFLPDVQAVIETYDGVTIMVDYQGYGCPYPRTVEPREDRTRVVVAARHWTEDPDWEFLNDSIAIGVGENRFTGNGVRLLLLDVHDVIWGPLSERPTARPELPDMIPIEPGRFDLGAIGRSRRVGGGGTTTPLSPG